MKKEFKIGIFVVSVIVVSFFVINYLRGKDIFNRELDVIGRYENAEGLLASAPVYIKGYKAGKVSSVVYDAAESCFIVTCSVIKDFNIPTDSRMIIYSVDIMGGKGVKIDLGASSETVKDGDTISSGYEAGLMDALAGGLDPILQKVGTTLDSLSVTVSCINSMLSPSNIKGIENTVAHLEITLNNLRSLSASVNGKSEEIGELLDNLSDFSAKLGGIAEKVDTTMAGVGQFVGELNNADVEGLVASFKNLVDNLNDPRGSVGKLLTDGSVYNSVDSLLVDINSLVKKIQENPKKYLKISVF